MPKGEKAPPFTKETAKAAGAAGGRKAAQNRREKKAIAELAADILRMRLTDKQIAERMVSLGVAKQPKEGADPSVTLGAAVLGALAERALVKSGDDKIMNAATSAAQVLLELADERRFTKKGSGNELDAVGRTCGVAIMPDAHAIEEYVAERKEQDADGDGA